MLVEAMKNIDAMLLSRSDYHPFPKYGEKGWDALPEEAKRVIVGRAELQKDLDWPVLPAVRYMDFVKDGNRSRYEALFFERRRRLREQVIAECIEHKGRFMDSIINGVWAICEETTWALPAHSAFYKPADQALVDIERDRVTLDLFAAETGANVALVLYLMGDALGEIDRTIPRRMEYEIDQRILKPFMDYNDFGWMGLDHDQPVNNWNPWICENVLSCALIAERSEARRVELVKKVGRVADRFLAFYAPDGGCDEGPGYFSVAGGSMMEVLEQLLDATAGRLNLFGEPLIRAMADYIRHVHIAEDYFVNFADAACATGAPYELLLRVAQLNGDDELGAFCRMQMARRSARPDDAITHGSGQPFRVLKSLFAWDEANYEGTAPVASLGHWFGGIQVATARSCENSFDGLFFAGKGGCNAESHNHNDIGNYIVYANGRPAVVDAGVGVYSKKTFSDQRYEIWSMQSGWHNTAVINGCDQKNGREYAAASVDYADDGKVMRLALDMQDAYGPEAQVKRWRRTFTFDRARNTLRVHDDAALAACVCPAKLPVMCLDRPEVAEGEARIGALMLRFDPAVFMASVEERPLQDSKLEGLWKRKSLWRLTLTRTASAADDAWTIEYSL